MAEISVTHLIVLSSSHFPIPLPLDSQGAMARIYGVTSGLNKAEWVHVHYVLSSADMATVERYWSLCQPDILNNYVEQSYLLTCK